MVSTRRASLLYLIGAAVQGLAAVVVQPFSIRLFGGVRSEGWETTAFAVAVMQVGIVVLSAGLPLAITRAWLEPGGGPLKARAINGFNGLFALALAVIGCLGAWAADVDPALVCAVWSMGGLAVVLAAQAQLRSQGRPLTFVALAGGSSLGAHLLGLVSIILFHPTAAHFMGGFALASTLTALAALIVTRPTWPSKAREAVKTAVVAGLPLLPHSLAMILLTQGDAMLLRAVAPPGDTGVYLAAAVFALGPVAVLAGLNNAWSPAIMKAGHHSEGEFRGTVAGTMKNAVTVATGVSVLGSLGAWLGVLVIAGGHAETTRIAAVLPIVGIGYALYLVAMSVLFARLATKSFAWLTLGVVLVSGLAAWWPAAHGALVAVAAVKAGAFALLGLGYAAVARARTPLPLGRWALGLALAAAVAALTLAVLSVLGA